MHPIPVRTMRFDLPDAKQFHPICIAGSSALSYAHLAMGLYVAYVEPFIVKSLQRVSAQIQDRALREEVERFARQEAQHYQRHIDLNNIVFNHDYPGLEQRCQQLKQEMDDFLATRPERFLIGYVEGFESYTTQLALWNLNSGLYDHHRTQTAIGMLFKWHMLEEIEHRNVAYDVYQHLYGQYFYRARLCFQAQSHMARFISDCTNIMSRTDIKRYGAHCRITPRQTFLMGLSRVIMRVRSMLPGYTPHHYSIPAKVQDMSAYFSKHAENIR